MRKFLLAAIQLDTQTDKQKNIEIASKYIREAAKAGAKIVAMPEDMNYIGNDYQGNAELIPGPTTDMFAELAQELNIWIHCGSITECVEGQKQPSNTTVLINPKGNIVAKYRKIHLYDAPIMQGADYKESDDVLAGNEIVLADTELAKLGLAICYDYRFGEIYKILSLNGAEIIFNPACHPVNNGKDHWELILRARAVDNVCYVVAPAQIGMKPKFQAYGRSIIVDPRGNVLAKAADREGWILAEIDLDYLESVRAQLPTLSNRRTDLYDLKCDAVRKL